MAPITTGKALFIGFIVHNDVTDGASGPGDTPKQFPEQAVHEITGPVDEMGTAKIFFVCNGKSNKNGNTSTVRCKARPIDPPRINAQLDDSW